MCSKIIPNRGIEFLFVHVPKRSSYYKPMDEFMFINYIPMGVFALCDLLNKNGISSRIKHMGIETILDEGFSIAEYVKNNEISMVGLSLHWHFQAFDVIDLVRKIKAASPTTSIVLGGITASLFSNEIMKSHEAVDFIIRGDAERGIVELVHAIKGGNTDFSKVSNCVWRSNGEIIANNFTYVENHTSADEVDYANLSLLDHYEQYRDFFKLPLFWSVNASFEQNMRMRISGASTTFPLMTGRGCPVNCSFCGGSKDAQKSFCNRDRAVYRSVKSVADTMEQAIQYGYESFVVCFDPFPSDDKFYIELFKEVRRRKINCGMGFESWGLPTREFIQEFGKTFIKKLSYIALSPETGSDEIRKKNKGHFYTNEQLYEVMKQFEAENVAAMIYLTLGLSGEHLSHIQETKQFSQALKKRFGNTIVSIITIPVQLEPGSPIFVNPEKYGIITERKCFKDFYEYHARPDSNPYSYFAYATDCLEGAEGDILKFAQCINKERCENFCIIQATDFRKEESAAMARAHCGERQKRWKECGFGEIPEERKTFK